MSLIKILMLAVVLILVFVSLGQAQNGLPAKDAEAIVNVLETYRAAWLKNDEKSVLALFTDDAALYPNGSKPVKSKTEVARFWFASSETITTIKAFDIKIEDLTGSADFAVLTGSNELRWTSEKRDKSESKSYVSKGYFMTVYAKRGGKWKILSQFWNAKTEEIK